MKYGTVGNIFDIKKIKKYKIFKFWFELKRTKFFFMARVSLSAEIEKNCNQSLPGTAK